MLTRCRVIRGGRGRGKGNATSVQVVGRRRSRLFAVQIVGQTVEHVGIRVEVGRVCSFREVRTGISRMGRGNGVV